MGHVIKPTRRGEPPAVLQFLITTGPDEPQGFWQIRAAYWERRRAWDRLEIRIARTQGGSAFIARMKRHRPKHHSYISTLV